MILFFQRLRRFGRASIATSGLIALCGLFTSCTQVNVVNPQTNLELAPAPYFDDTTGIYFPGALGPLFRRPVVKLEERSPGLGLAISYRNPEARIDVFVYDLQASIIPTGDDSEVIEKSFQDAIADLNLAAAKRIYSQLTIDAPIVRTFAQTDFRHARFDYTEGLTPKEGELYVTGVNGQILKIRTAKRQGSAIEMSRLLSYIGHAIEQSHRNGYGGISTSDYQRISTQLAKIDLSDGLSQSEAISIAQIELVNKKQHHRYDAISGSCDTTLLPKSAIVTFEQYPTTPARIAPTPIRIKVKSTGNAEILGERP